MSEEDFRDYARASGQVLCPTHIALNETTLHEFATALEHSCPDCKAQV